jgi:hypothetical protein
MSYLASKLAMDEEVVYGLLTLLVKATPIKKRKPPPPKVINHKNFIQSRCQREESDTRWSLHLPLFQGFIITYAKPCCKVTYMMLHFSQTFR